MFTFSMHCGKNFPFRKQQSDLDVVLDVETGDKDYLSLLTVSFLFNMRSTIFIYYSVIDNHNSNCEEGLNHIF